MDEAAAMLRMQVDSRPEELDRAERRIDQLMIESEMLKRETDDASRARLAKLEEEIDELRSAASTLRAQWEGEKGLMDQIGELTERLERVRFEAEQAERVADYETAARLRYGDAAEIEKQLEQCRERLGGDPRAAARSCSRRRSTPTTSPASSAAGPGIPVAKLARGRGREAARRWRTASTRA